MKDHRSLIIVGHSMGGLIASEYAARHPELVEKIVLCNSAGLPVKTSLTCWLPLCASVLVGVIRNTPLLDAAAHKLGDLIKWHGTMKPISYDDLRISMEHLDEEADRPFLQNMYDSAKRILFTPSGLRFIRSLKFLYKSWVHQISIASRTSVALNVLRNLPLLDANHAETLKKIPNKTEVLIIWGEDDGLLPKSLVKDFQTHIPHCKLVTVPGDHAPFLQKPVTIFKSIISFISSGMAS